jgi:transcriptional regulator with XRE-family HTH domain
MLTSKHGLAERLVTAREAAGLSQSELARRVGIAPQSVQAIEAGETKHTRFLVKIADILGVSPAWLQGGAGPMKPVAVDGATPGDEVEQKARELTDLLLQGQNVSPRDVLECYADMLELARRFSKLGERH